MNSDLVLIANAGDSTLTSFVLEGDALRHLTTTALPGACSTFAVDAARDLVYAGIKAGPGSKVPALLTLALDRASGALTEIGRRASGSALTYLELTSDGGLLLGASYHAGVGAVWPAVEGVIGEPRAEVHFPNLHCVKVSADDAYAYFVSLGDDLVAQYRLSAEGTLTPLDPPVARAVQGCGARHLILSENQKNAYLATEFSGEVFRYARASDGMLTRAEKVSFVDARAGLKHSTFGADPRKEHLIWGADLHLTASEKYLLATERFAGTIATIALDADGRLGEVVALRATEPQPRGFYVAPDGEHVVVAGELSTTASLYRVGAGGVLNDLDRVETGRGANWVRIVASR